MSRLEKAIIRTLAYADIFDYPLTEEEIWKWLINFRIKNFILRKGNKQVIREKDGYYVIKGRDRIIKLRPKKEEWSNNKIKKLNNILFLFKLIPTIKLVGITGALAVNNTKKDDDIDLIIITKEGTIWTTRFLITLLLDLLGKRRRPRDKNINNKICLNMFVDEKHLKVYIKERDLFSAHELIQMKPIFDRDNTYNQFIKANRWVRKYLPNALNSIMSQWNNETVKDKVWFHNFMVIWLRPIELLLKHIQLRHMNSRRTTEVIREGYIRFHPKDARIWVMKEYKEKIKKYSLTSII